MKYLSSNLVRRKTYSEPGFNGGKAAGFHENDKELMTTVPPSTVTNMPVVDVRTVGGKATPAEVGMTCRENSYFSLWSDHLARLERIPARVRIDEQRFQFLEP